MGVLQIPIMTGPEREKIVLAPAEIIYDETHGVMCLGNGIAVGGLPLIADKSQQYKRETVTGPEKSTDGALALFSGDSGAVLREGPAPGDLGTVLLGQGTGQVPVSGPLTLANLSVATGNTAAPAYTNDVVIYGSDNRLSLRRMPTASLAPEGTIGQVLTSNGNVAPTYKDPHTGSFVQIGTQLRVSGNVDVVEFTKGIDTTYDTYLLIGTGIKTPPPKANANANAVPLIQVQIKDSTGIKWVQENKYIVTVPNAAANPAQSTPVGNISLSGPVGNTATNSSTIKMHMFSPGVSGLYTTFMVDHIAVGTANNKPTVASSSYFGCITETAPVTGIRIKFSAGQISSGTFTLYGLDKGKLNVEPGGGHAMIILRLCIFRVPRTTTARRMNDVPSTGELFFDIELGAMFYGDGKTPGGVMMPIGTGWIDGVADNVPVLTASGWLRDSGVAISDIITGPYGSADGNFPVFNGPAGNVLKDSGASLTDLRTAINSKAAARHIHAIDDVSGLQAALTLERDALQTDLKGKASVGHTHMFADIPGLQTALSERIIGLASSTKGNVPVFDDTNGKVLKDSGASLTDLQKALNGKAAADHIHPSATTTKEGFLSFADKTKLDGIASGATNTPLASTPPATLGPPATGTGTAAARADHVHAMPTAAQVGAAAATHTHAAGNIASDTFDLARLPVAASGTSSATQVVRADDSRLSNARTPTAHAHVVADVTGITPAGIGAATLADVDARIKTVVGAAPAALDTLKELADAFGSDANFAGKVTTQLADKAAVKHAHVIADVTDLQKALNSKAAIDHVHAVLVTAPPSSTKGNILVFDDTSDKKLKDSGTSLATLQKALNGKAAADHIHPSATTTQAGLMSVADKTKLDGIVTTALGFTPENMARRNVANGYAGLDANGKIAAGQIPNTGGGMSDDTVIAHVRKAARYALAFANTDTGKSINYLEDNGNHGQYLQSIGEWMPPIWGTPPFSSTIRKITLLSLKKSVLVPGSLDDRTHSPSENILTIRTEQSDDTVCHLVIGVVNFAPKDRLPEDVVLFTWINDDIDTKTYPQSGASMHLMDVKTGQDKHTEYTLKVHHHNLKARTGDSISVGGPDNPCFLAVIEFTGVQQ